MSELGLVGVKPSERIQVAFAAYGTAFQALVISKDPAALTVAYGSTANFTINVQNADTIFSIVNIVVSDPNAPNCNRNIGTLAPNTKRHTLVLATMSPPISLTLQLQQDCWVRIPRLPLLIPQLQASSRQPQCQRKCRKQTRFCYSAAASADSRSFDYAQDWRGCASGGHGVASSNSHIVA